MNAGDVGNVTVAGGVNVRYANPDSGTPIVCGSRLTDEIPGAPDAGVVENNTGIVAVPLVVPGIETVPVKPAPTPPSAMEAGAEPAVIVVEIDAGNVGAGAADGPAGGVGPDDGEVAGGATPDPPPEQPATASASAATSGETSNRPRRVTAERIIASPVSPSPRS